MFILAYRIRKSEVFAWDRNSYLTNAIPPPKRNCSREFGLHWLYRMSRNFVVRLTSLRRQSDVIKKCPTLASLYAVMNAIFKIKQHSKSKGMQEKESNMSVRADRKFRPSGSVFSITRHRPRDAKQ